MSESVGNETLDENVVDLVGGTRRREDDSIAVTEKETECEAERDAVLAVDSDNECDSNPPETEVEEDRNPSLFERVNVIDEGKLADTVSEALS